MSSTIGQKKTYFCPAILNLAYWHKEARNQTLNSCMISRKRRFYFQIRTICVAKIPSWSSNKILGDFSEKFPNLNLEISPGGIVTRVECFDTATINRTKLYKT
jgi:hypothetical protein